RRHYRRESMFEQSCCITPDTAFHFAQGNSDLLIHKSQPSRDVRAPAAVMLQASNGKGTGICLQIRKYGLAATKVRNPRTPNLCREMPAAATTVFHQFFFPVMFPVV